MNTTMTQTQQESLLTLSLMAAFADGEKNEVERAELKRIASTLPGTEANHAALYQRVLLRQVTLPEVVAPLETQPLRQLGYEIAVCVCDADDTLNSAEQDFLHALKLELKLEGETARAVESGAQAIAGAAVEAPPVIAPPDPAAAQVAGAGRNAEVDRMVLNYSILNGALELLPDSLATMAIVPMQMKMVYRIGKVHGFELDRRHIVELLGAAGVGLTSQVVEGFARKLIGGLFGKVGGGLGRSVGNQLASSAMSFASTYALGQVAQIYYAGGRQLSSGELKERFSSLLGQARSLHGRYAGEIQDRARSINPSQLLSLVRGSG